MAAWLRPKQTDLVPGKGQFRLAFSPSAQLLLSDNDFSGSQPTPTNASCRPSNRMRKRGGTPSSKISSPSVPSPVSICRNLLIVSMPVTVGGVVAVVMVLVAR